MFGAVMRWVKADEEMRTGELNRLLPLEVRFPMMASIEAAEPLLARHSLSAQLLAECDPEFEEADCPRLRPRVGQLRGGGRTQNVLWMGTTDGFELPECRVGGVQDRQDGGWKDGSRRAGGLAMGEQGRGGGDHGQNN